MYVRIYLSAVDCIEIMEAAGVESGEAVVIFPGRATADNNGAMIGGVAASRAVAKADPKLSEAPGLERRETQIPVLPPPT
jgi:hypothetical protein